MSQNYADKLLQKDENDPWASDCTGLVSSYAVCTNELVAGSLRRRRGRGREREEGGVGERGEKKKICLKSIGNYHILIYKSSVDVGDNNCIFVVVL